MPPSDLLTLFLQIGLIVALSRATGWVFARFHQPPVMGEMIAGILLGPSLLGWIAPHLWLAIFPPQSTQYLNILSQVGVVFDVDPGEAQLRMRMRHLGEQRPIFAADAAPVGTQAHHPQGIAGVFGGDGGGAQDGETAYCNGAEAAIIDAAACYCFYSASRKYSAPNGPFFHKFSSAGWRGISSALSSGGSGVVAGSASNT